MLPRGNETHEQDDRFCLCVPTQQVRCHTSLSGQTSHDASQHHNLLHAKQCDSQLHVGL